MTPEDYREITEYMRKGFGRMPDPELRDWANPVTWMERMREPMEEMRPPDPRLLAIEMLECLDRYLAWHEPGLLGSILGKIAENVDNIESAEDLTVSGIPDSPLQDVPATRKRIQTLIAAFKADDGSGSANSNGTAPALEDITRVLGTTRTAAEHEMRKAQ